MKVFKMGKSMEELYGDAPRFDCGDLYQSEEYDEALREQLRLEALIEKLYGNGILPLLGEYTEALYQISELECKHFFQQGYLAGRQGR